MAKTIDPKVQEEKIRQLAKYIHDRAYNAQVYSPLTLYAVNKEVDLVPHKCLFLRLKETSVTGNHWSVRAKNN
jgi:hypothetical protein